jgi:hypothetical protein
MGRALGTLQHILAPRDEPRPYAVPPPAEAQARLEAVLGEAERVRGRSAVDETCCRVLRHKLEPTQASYALAARASIFSYPCASASLRRPWRRA